MLLRIFYAALAAFVTWLVLDMVVEAMFPRLMDPSVTQFGNELVAMRSGRRTKVRLGGSTA